MTETEYARFYYINRKSNGLCPRCGKELDREGHYCSTCLAKTNDYQNETRVFMRSIGVCPYCRKEKLYGDERRCIECSAKAFAYAKPLTEEQKIRYGNNFKEYQRNLYRERADQGICTKCGKRKAKHKRKKCANCLDKESERARFYRARKEKKNE